MLRRYSIAVVLVCIALASFVRPVAAQDCEGTSGSATINGSPWSAFCVIAMTNPSCIDSLGKEYECFEISGLSLVDSTAFGLGVAIFLAHPPTQGQIYPLGGDHPDGALVFWQGDLALTGAAPYTGQVNITTYDTATSTITCTFSFTAHGFSGDVVVTDGTFEGRFVGVKEKSWSEVKQLYRTP